MAVNSPEHPDAVQDYEEICKVVEEKLAPIFAKVGNWLRDHDKRIESVEQFASKVADGLGEAVNEHRRGSITGMVSDKFGPDLDMLNPFMQDLTGKDYATQLIEMLMQSDDEPNEDMIRQIIESDKGRFGKYINMQPGSAQAPEVSVEPQGEAEAEHEALGKEEPIGEPPELEKGSDSSGSKYVKKGTDTEADKMARDLARFSNGLKNKTAAEPKAVGK